MKTSIPVFLAIFLFVSCQPEKRPVNPAAQPAFTPDGINVVVEIPAGTNQKIEYQKSSGGFETDRRDGKIRHIDFLPYPGNYGFVPSTVMSPENGGDGDPVDVLLICESMPTGSLVEAIPIGALQLLDEGEMDTKVIAIPRDTALQTLSPKDFTDFSIRYDGARHIIETWFLYYDGLGTNTFKGWIDEKKATALIRKYEQ